MAHMKHNVPECCLNTYEWREQFGRLEGAYAPATMKAYYTDVGIFVEWCEAHGIAPRARIRCFANASDEPVKMLSGHLRATEKLLRATGLRPNDIDLWEINESFASTVLMLVDGSAARSSHHHTCLQ